MTSFFAWFQIVVNALVRAIPEIINVYLVSMVFWLIFSAVGVQFFSGMFYKCVDTAGKKLAYEQVYTKYDFFWIYYNTLNVHKIDGLHIENMPCWEVPVQDEQHKNVK